MRFVALMLLGALATLAVAADAQLVGKDAPEISTPLFYLTDGRTRVADFKGEVVFLQCFATW